METQTKSTLKAWGLVGLITLSGCSKKVNFMDGEDRIRISHTGLTEAFCGGSINVEVIKKDGSIINYYGGRAGPYSEVQPKLDRVMAIAHGETINIECNNPKAYRNFTNYIGMAESLHRAKVERVLDSL